MLHGISRADCGQPLRRSMLSVADSMQSHHLGNITSSDGSLDAAMAEGGSCSNSQEASQYPTVTLTLPITLALTLYPKPRRCHARGQLLTLTSA